MKINIKAITEWVNAFPGRDANIVIEAGTVSCYLSDNDTKSGAFLDEIGRAPRYMAYPIEKARGGNHGQDLELTEFAGARTMAKVMCGAREVNHA